MSIGGSNHPDSRPEDETADTAPAHRLDRRFSGERLKGAGKREWLAKAAFAAGTVVVLLFVLTHGSKAERAKQKEARAVAQIEEPSVRDYRPPVMPAQLAVDASPAVPAPTPSANQSAGKSQDDAEALANRRKAAQLNEARTKSDILVRAAGSTSAAPAGAAPVAPSAMPAQLAFGLGRQTASSDGPADPNLAFARQASGKPVVTAMPKRLGNLECLALQGKMIDATLDTAINTDLPGQIRASVSSPLYAEQGRAPLVPAGSRLMGVYNAAVRKGQVRVFAIWNRVIRPDGSDIAIDSAMTDALGQAGVAGETDTHFGEIFGMSALLSVIGAGAGTAGVSPDARSNSADDYRREIQQSFARTSDRVLEPYVNMPPTNTVAQGARIKVFLNRDLDFCAFKQVADEATELVLP